MALSTEAAEALVAGYLAGRTLPPAVHKAVVLAARARLIDGDVPVLDEMLCIDSGVAMGVRRKIFDSALGFNTTVHDERS